MQLISQTLLHIKRQIGPDTITVNDFNNLLSSVNGHIYVSFHTWPYMSQYIYLYDKKAEGGLFGKRKGQVEEVGTGEDKGGEYDQRA